MGDPILPNQYPFGYIFKIKEDKGDATLFSMIAYMVADYGDGSLSDYGRVVRRDLSTLSVAVSQIREELERDLTLRKLMKYITRELAKKITK